MKTNNPFIAAACDQSGEICELIPLSPTWCASVDAELAATSEEDKKIILRTWNALSDEDRLRAFNSLPDMLDGFLKKWGWLHFAQAIEAICREKNACIAPDTTLPATAVAEGAQLDGESLEQAE